MITAHRRACAAGLAVAVGAMVALSACSEGDGRALRPPAPGQTLPPSTPSTVSGDVAVGSPSGPVVAMVLVSPSFAEGTAIPDVYACDGANESPPLEWTDVPAGTVELAITVTDDDASGFVHWVVSGLDPALTGISQGALPEGAVESRTTNGDIGWFGPCPPQGTTHHYQFTLYALSRASGLPLGADPLQAVSTVAGLAQSQAVLNGVFTRA